MTITRTSIVTNAALGATYTPDSGANRYVLLFAQSDTDLSYSAVSINSVAMTLLQDDTNHTAHTQVWGLVIPDAWSGAKTITSTGSAAKHSWASFAGVNPSTPVYDSQKDGSGSSTDTTATVTINGIVGGYIQGAIALTSTYTPTKGANQTSDWAVNNFGTSYYTTVTTAALTFSYTFTGSRNSMVAVSLNPSIPFIPQIIVS